MVVVSHLFFFFQINFREGMTQCKSYPPCFGTIYFPTAPFSYCTVNLQIQDYSLRTVVLITISGFMNVCQEKPQDFPFFHGKPCEKRETQDYSRYRDLAWKCFLPGFPLPEK